MTDLPKYNWDQATILGLATAQGFQAVGINPATIRQWVSRDYLTAVGRAPGGAHLYVYADVVKVAESPGDRTATRLA